MRFAFDTSVVSSKRLAIYVVCLTGLSFLIDWPPDAVAGRLLALALGAALLLSRVWFVRHPVADVINQLQDPLQLSDIEYVKTDGSVTVVSTGTCARVWSCYVFSIVGIKLCDPRCPKERFLAEVLTKYLRFIRKKSHG